VDDAHVVGLAQRAADLPRDVEGARRVERPSSRIALWSVRPSSSSIAMK
jgi:hypothetical protein